MKNVIIGTALRNDKKNEIVIAAFYRIGIFDSELFGINYVVKITDINRFKDLYDKYVRLELIYGNRYVLNLL